MSFGIEISVPEFPDEPFRAPAHRCLQNCFEFKNRFHKLREEGISLDERRKRFEALKEFGIFACNAECEGSGLTTPGEYQVCDASGDKELRPWAIGQSLAYKNQPEDN